MQRFCRNKDQASKPVHRLDRMAGTACQTALSTRLYEKGKSASLWGAPGEGEAGACHIGQGGVLPLLRRRKDAHAYWRTGHRKRRLRRHSIHIALHIRGMSAQALLRCQCSSDTAHTCAQATATAVLDAACTVMHALARPASKKRKAKEVLHAQFVSIWTCCHISLKSVTSG